jgi:hypothetical protein
MDELALGGQGERPLLDVTDRENRPEVFAQRDDDDLEPDEGAPVPAGDPGLKDVRAGRGLLGAIDVDRAADDEGSSAAEEREALIGLAGSHRRTGAADCQRAGERYVRERSDDGEVDG